MSEVCGDNRFELIGEFKGKLVEGTNIETSPEEMAVLDNILFRFWQMGWLDKLKAQEPRVLALDEIHRGMAVWLEDVDKADVILAIGGSSCGGCKCFITVDDRSIAPHDSDYGVRWRAWTREPTAEQRRETHWACLRRM